MSHWVLKVKGVVISLPPAAQKRQPAYFLAGRKEEYGQSLPGIPEPEIP
jgi:hypothetical protein